MTTIRVGIVRARWNATIVQRLYDSCCEYLRANGVLEANIHTLSVPGSFELPLAAARLLPTCDVVVCIGTLIKGETSHYEFISAAVSNGIMKLSSKYHKPVVFGVLTCQSAAEAEQRANEGDQFARTALAMAIPSADLVIDEPTGIDQVVVAEFQRHLDRISNKRRQGKVDFFNEGIGLDIRSKIDTVTWPHRVISNPIRRECIRCARYQTQQCESCRVYICKECAAIWHSRLKIEVSSVNRRKRKASAAAGGGGGSGDNDDDEQKDD